MQLLIEHKGNLIEPPIEEGIVWTTDRVGTPSTLTFNIKPDEPISLEEGSAIRLTDGEDKIFFGFLFKSKESKKDVIPITAYDQLRYLKNKNSYNFIGQTASEIIKKIASDFILNIGDIEDTGYRIPSLKKQDSSLFDIIQSALDITLMNTKSLYVLYDNFGKLTLKNIKNTQINIQIDEDCCEDYQYDKDIDSDTYNQIKLVEEDSKTKSRKIYIAKDSSKINKWGMLQMYEKLGEKENGQVKADALLTLKNRVLKKLSVKNALGDNQVRAGVRLLVQIQTKSTPINSIMLVDKAKHTYKKDQHLMDLELRSGEYE